MFDREIPRFDVEAISDAVRQPPLADLYRAAARRRRRRVSGMTLIVVAALAVTTAPFAIAGPNGERPEPAPPQAQSSPSVVSELFMMGATSAVAVELSDGGCTIRFGRTDDLGRTWSEFRPMPDMPDCRRHADGQGKASFVRYQPLSLRTYLVSVDDRSYLSRDVGRTWRDARSAMSVVNAFPAGADPVDCQMPCLGVSEPLAVDPDTGKVFRLRSKAPSPYPLHSMYESPDGALWATYWPGDGRLSVVARSVDRGATWVASTMPKQFTAGDAPLSLLGLAAESRQVAYLVTEPSRRDGPPEKGTSSRLFRTSDGGRTWTEGSTDLPASSLFRPMTVGSDRSLLVADFSEDRSYVWVSRDGGRHFAKGAGVGRGGAAGAVPGLVWVTDAGGASLTSDGTTWTGRLTFPR